MNRVSSAFGVAETCRVVASYVARPLLIFFLAACTPGDVGQDGSTAQGGGSPGSAPQVPTVSISANPTDIASGDSSMLTWLSSDATSCTASGAWSGNKATSGSQSTNALTAGSTFVLTCTGPGGMASASASVTVQGGPPPAPAPTVSLTANPTSVQSGQASALTWSSTNATSCTASGGWSGTQATSGNNVPTGALTVSTTFNLSCTGAGGTASTSRTVTILPPPVAGQQDFATRCAQPGVLRCIGFDSTSDFAGTYGNNTGTLAGAAAPARDTSVMASGASSLRFTIPSNSGPNTSGSYFANFSTDLSQQFGANEVFYVQWRQRFSPEFLNTIYTNGGGWKQSIIGTGDKPGCNTSDDTNCYSSCSDLETVVQNTGQRGYAQMYNSCGVFEPFDEPFQGTFKRQNARPAPYCLHSQNGANQFPPNGNCFGYFANEWMTFQVRIQTGPRVGNVWQNSLITLWIARQGQASEMAINFTYDLAAGSAAENQRFGKVWLLPYHTDKSSSQSHAVAFTWYDELVISRNQIADPTP